MMVDVGAATAGPLFDAERVTVPVVAGRGGSSKPYHRRSAEWLVEHIAGAELYEIPGATHGAHKSHPVEFAAFVCRAVERGEA
jgi:pimeloyl-ACP methyl ester carboxylesterase